MDKDLDMKQEDAVDSDNEDDVAGNKKGRRKIKIEFIEDKSRRHITFSKRKAGIMKKAYELATLTGTQVLLLVASETGHVYTFATPKLQPLITKPEGKNLIQSCLNAPDTQSAPAVSRSDSQGSVNGSGYDGFPGPIAPGDYAGSPTDGDDEPPKNSKPKRKARGKAAEVKQEQNNATAQSAALLQAQSQAAAAQQAAAQQQALQAQQLAQQQQAAQQQQLLQAQQQLAQQQQANLLPQHIYSQLQGMQALPNGAMAYMPQVRMAQYPYTPAAFQQLGGTFVYPRAGAQPGDHDAATQHAVQQLMSQTHAGHDHSDSVQ